jgi:antitoxin CcdA
MTNPASRRATTVKLPAAMVEEAMALGINVSRSCETGIQAPRSAERERRRRIENANAIAAYNRWIEENGIPLEEFRSF